MARQETNASLLRQFVAIAETALCATALALVTACGGGGEQAIEYTVVVKTVDTQGKPVAGVGVYLNGSFNGMSATTGTEGITTFNFSARGTDASVGTYVTGYHWAGRQFQLDRSSTPIAQQLTLIRTDEIRLAVIGAMSETSADASSAVVSVDIGVFNQNGNSIETLTAVDFAVPTIDCLGFGYPCILESTGAPSDSGYWYPSRTRPVEVSPPVSGLSTHYIVRYVLESKPGMFTSGRTAITWINVRLGADTSVDIQVDVRL